MNRLTPHATAILILAANAPDADIVTLGGGGLNYFHYHRHLSHSLIFAPILAVVVVALVRVAAKKPFPLVPAFLVALVGLASHLLLDLTNSYGVRLLLPFSAAWLHWDLTNIFDLWIWAVFALCLAAPFLSRLVGGEIGGPSKARYPGRGFAVFALLFLCFYDGGRAILHARALATLETRIYDGAAPIRVAAFPPASNPFHWRGLAESQPAYHLFDLDVTQPFDPTAGQSVPKLGRSPATDLAASSEPFRVLSGFAQYPVWRSAPAVEPEGATEVTLMDLRFPFFAEAVVTGGSASGGGTLVSARFSYGR